MFRLNLPIQHKFFQDMTMKGIITLLAILAPSLHAADLTVQLQQCRSVTNDLQRLICYDKIGKTGSASTYTTVAAATTNTIVARTQATAEEASSNPVAEFGLEHKETARKIEAIDNVSLELQSTETNKLGFIVFTFTNGQVWRQTTKEFFSIEEGNTYQVERGILGAFYLSKAGTNRKVRVVREQ
jgi:hypothetical protein